MLPSKIALFLPLQEHGHLLPTFKIASRLARDGWDVRYPVTEAFKPLVEERGFASLPMFDDQKPFLDERGTPFRARTDMRPSEKVAAYFAGQTAMYQVFRDMLERIRPDAMLFDLFYSDYAIHALDAGIPAAVYHVCLDAESFAAPPLIRRYGAPRNVFEAARMRLDWLFLWSLRRRRHLRPWRIPCIRSALAKAAQRERGLSPRVCSTCQFAFDINNFVLGPAAISRRNLPENRYFGLGLRDEPQVGNASSIPQFDNGLPTVYFSLGSMSARYPAAYRVISDTIDAFRAAGRINLIAQVGTHYDALADRSSGNIRVERFVPQIECLKRVDAVITHGGYGTIKECVAHRRPMLIVPFFQDQLGGARRCVELGIAETLDHRRYDAQRALEIVERLIADPAPRARLAQLYSPEKDEEEFERAYAELLRRIGG